MFRDKGDCSAEKAEKLSGRVAPEVSEEKRREAEEETFRGEGLLGLLTELADARGISKDIRGTFPACAACRTTTPRSRRARTRF